MLTVLVIGAIAMLLAFANGANDNAKGVATLVGSGLLSVRRAISYATVMTFLGGLAAAVFATALVAPFSGKGIVDPSIASQVAFPAAVAFAAAATVLLATVIGMPISTTHALVGAIVGTGLASSSLLWGAAAQTFMIPLLVSPLIAFAVTAILYLVFRRTRLALGITHETCICVEPATPVLTNGVEPALRLARVPVDVTVCEAVTGRPRYDGRVAGLDAQTALHGLHLLTAGATSFARGLNDTPKIAALMLVAGIVGGPSPLGAMVAVCIGMAIGGLLAARRVARTMSFEITGMNDGQAFTANLVTAFLVIVASRFGVPVSTTHVSCGGLFGIGAVTGRGHWRSIGTILLAWVVTLPVAGILAWAAWSVVGGM